MRIPTPARRAIFLTGLLMTSTLFAADADRIVTVSAGNYDRPDTPVSFPLPPGVAGGEWELRDDAGGVTPLQTDGGSRATFVLRDLKAGQSRAYHLQPTVRRVAAPTPVAAAAREGGNVNLTLGGKDVLRYQGDKSKMPADFPPAYARGGYIHPVYTPGGVPVTDDYPPNHKHHHGVWSPWTKTAFEGRHPDFWNMGDKTGTVEPVSLDAVWSGPVVAGFRAKHRFVDLSAKPQPKDVLNETWEVNVYAAGGAAYRLFDWQSVETCATDSPLTLPKYHYGGLGVRGRRDWDGPGDVCQFLTSEGKTRKDGDEAPSRWCRISGMADGKRVSLSVLCHPDNFRAPQPVRIHPSEPYISFCPQWLGEFKIEPGKPYTARYRFVAADGEPDAGELDRLWKDYAHPPEVGVK